MTKEPIAGTLGIELCTPHSLIPGQQTSSVSFTGSVVWLGFGTFQSHLWGGKNLCVFEMSKG